MEEEIRIIGNNIVKKLFVVFLFSGFLFILPCLAANWEQVDDKGKMFIDTLSIQEYNYGSRAGQYYSFWMKNLNKNDEVSKKIEKIFKKKYWYSKDKIIINCKDELIAIKSTVYYDLAGEPIPDSSYEHIALDWHSIIPESNGEFWYNIVCSPQINHENPNSKNIPSNVKIKIKDGRSKHWSSI